MGWMVNFIIKRNLKIDMACGCTVPTTGSGHICCFLGIVFKMLEIMSYLS